jgi:uncharacterized protein (TIGR02217 family)
MSSFIYPATIPGLTFENVRTPIWSTGKQNAVSGKQSRIGYRQYPLWRFELQYELLRDVTPSDLKALVGLFNAMQGGFDTFLFTDPSFNSVTAESFGTGNGATTAFQLIAKYQNAGGPGIADLIQNVNGTPSIFKAGVLQTGGGVNYTLGPTGIVTFTSAPAAGAALTWTGSFYYRCAFDEDEFPVTHFLTNFWKTKTVSFTSIKL